MEIYNWIIKHWPELVAALGLGGGGGIASKKLTDKQQDKKISELEKQIHGMKKDAVNLKHDVTTNTLLDQQFREQMAREYNSIQGDISEVKTSVNNILTHLLSK